MSKATLRDLATHLQLGKSTVQRALAGSARVSPQTRQRVHKAAEELGYRHDLYFAALSARRRTRNNGSILVHYLYNSATTQGARSTVVGFFQTWAKEMGIEVELVDLESYSKVETIPRILLQRGSQGFIVGHCNRELLPALHEAYDKVPIICCQRQVDLPFHTVRFSVAECVRMCWKHLWDAGYRRIGCAVMKHPRCPIVSHNPAHIDDLDRLGAAVALMADHLSEDEQIPPLRAHLHDVDAYAPWLKEHKPDAVVGFFPEHVDRICDEQGRPIPFVALHAGHNPLYAHVPGSHTSGSMLVREALRQMSSLIRHGNGGVPEQIFHFLVEPTWHHGAGIPNAK